MTTIWEPEPDEEIAKPEVRSAIDGFVDRLKVQGDRGQQALGTRASEEFKFYHKASLALVSSDQETWGMVEDTSGDLLWTPGKGEIVGTWSRSKIDDLVHVSLTTSLQALLDRSVQIWAKYAEERKADKVVGAKKAKAPKSKVQIEEQVPELPVEEKLAFNALRAKLKKAKRG